MENTEEELTEQYNKGMVASSIFTAVSEVQSILSYDFVDLGLAKDVLEALKKLEDHVRD